MSDYTPIVPALPNLPTLPRLDGNVLRWSHSFSMAVNNAYRVLAQRADAAVIEGAVANIPAANGTKRFFWDPATNRLYYDDGAWVLIGSVANSNTANVTPGVADFYITGSNLVVGPSAIRVGTTFRWKFGMTKTAAGVAPPVWSVRFGTAGTVADTARLVFTGVAQTAAIDTASVEITCVTRVAGASGVVAGVYSLEHTLAATGFAVAAQDVIGVVSGAFDTSVAGMVVGVSVNAGAAAAWTIQMVTAELS